MFPSEKYVFDDITPEDEIVLSKQKFTQLEIERRLQYKDNHVLLSEEESYQLKDTYFEENLYNTCPENYIFSKKTTTKLTVKDGLRNSI